MRMSASLSVSRITGTACPAGTDRSRRSSSNPSVSPAGTSATTTSGRRWVSICSAGSPEGTVLTLNPAASSAGRARSTKAWSSSTSRTLDRVRAGADPVSGAVVLRAVLPCCAGFCAPYRRGGQAPVVRSLRAMLDAMQHTPARRRGRGARVEAPAHRLPVGALLVVLLMLIVTACAGRHGAVATPSPTRSTSTDRAREARVWVTTADGRSTLTERPAAVMHSGSLPGTDAVVSVKSPYTLPAVLGRRRIHDRGVRHTGRRPGTGCPGPADGRPVRPRRRRWALDPAPAARRERLLPLEPVLRPGAAGTARPRPAAVLARRGRGHRPAAGPTGPAAEPVADGGRHPVVRAGRG